MQNLSVGSHLNEIVAPPGVSLIDRREWLSFIYCVVVLCGAPGF